MPDDRIPLVVLGVGLLAFLLLSRGAVLEPPPPEPEPAPEPPPEPPPPLPPNFVF